MINLQELIRKRILNDEVGDIRAIEPIEVFHPSTLGFCERQIFLSKINAKDFDEITKGSMQSGTVLHSWIEHFPELLDSCVIEKPITIQIQGTLAFIKGNADIVTKDNSYVWDIKSTKTLSYLQSSPMSHHIPQINVYMAGLNANEGELLYIEKNTLQTVKHVLAFNKILFEQTCQKIIKVYEALKVWENAGGWNNPIPFEKCKGRCFFCETESIKPEFLKLMQKVV